MSAQLSLHFCVFIVEVYISTTNTSTAQSTTSLSHMPPTTMNSNPLTYTASSADSWSCNFEGLDQFCGMRLQSNGVNFKTGARSYSVSTGPMSDHSGSGEQPVVTDLTLHIFMFVCTACVKPTNNNWGPICNTDNSPLLR